MAEEKEEVEIKDSDVFILSAVRTPLGTFGGSLSSLNAVELGAIAIKGALEKAQIKPEQVNEVLMGNVLQANIGQNPARQASVKSGIADTVPATTINVICSSGMKAVSMAAQSLALLQNDICVAGGMESMSNAPYYLQNHRFGARFGDQTIVDGMMKDGLWDNLSDMSMGMCAEWCAAEYNISREEQDDFAILSFKKAILAHKEHLFDREILPVTVHNPKTKTKEVVTTDESISKLNEDKLRTLKGAFPITHPVYKNHSNFTKDKNNNPIYTVTAGNSSPLSDGAAALVLINGRKIKELKLYSKALAKIVGYADCAQEPIRFPMSPSLSIPKALKRAGINNISELNENDWFEINEAFALAGVGNSRILKIPMEKINTLGGAVALGHPLGCSGARILCTLITTLKLKKGRYGIAGICNGGGGSSAMILQNI